MEETTWIWQNGKITEYVYVISGLLENGKTNLKKITAKE